MIGRMAGTVLRAKRRNAVIFFEYYGKRFIAATCEEGKEKR